MKISHKFIIKFHQLHLLDLKLHEDEDKSKQSWLLGVIHQVAIIWLCLKASVPFVTRSQAKPIVKNDITRLHHNHNVCEKNPPIILSNATWKWLKERNKLSDYKCMNCKILPSLNKL